MTNSAGALYDMKNPINPIVMEVANNELFKDAPEEVIIRIVAEATPLALSSGEVLLSPMRDNHHVFLLLSGTLALHFDSLDSPEIRELPTGVSVGEMSIIDDEPPSAYIVAKTDCRVLPLHRDTLKRLIAETSPVTSNLLRLMTKWINANTRRIVQDRLRIRELTDHANIDGLTGLYNRRWLDNTLARLLEQTRKDSMPFTILFIDVDNFKPYNDTHGHESGDRALIALSEVLKTTSRPYDFPTRYGGEEFLILLQNTEAEIGIRIAERLRQAVEEKSVVSSDGTPLPGITISIGLATSEADSTPKSLIAAADSRLYQAKRTGRNRLCHCATQYSESQLPGSP